jgi:riboflavin biosynthesis pyrimidine reductase
MTTSSSLRRLHPAPVTTTTVGDAYDVLRPAPADRPWMNLCMVSSLDGSVAIDGSSGGLGNPNDREVLTTLRRLADVVLVGAGTAMGEGYGPPSKPGQRIAVATNSGRVDLDRPLFESGAGFLIAPESAVVDETRVDVLRAGRDRLDVALAVTRLGEISGRDVHLVQAEGGPTLNGALWEAGLVDELDLTISPIIAGGDAPRIVSGAAQLRARMELAHLLSDDDGFVFGRWLRRHG